MNLKSARMGLSTIAVAAALMAAATGVGAEPLDNAEKLAALEKRVATLERKRSAAPAVPEPAASRRAEVNAPRSAAAALERYLQYPGE